MKQKYFILAFMFLCMLCGQGSYALTTGESDIDEWADFNHDGIPDIFQLDDVVIIGPGNPADSHDPCDPFSSSYDFYTCNGMGNDSADPCDPFSSFYDPYLCGGDTGDPCDPFSSAYNTELCNGNTGGNVNVQGTDNTNNSSKDYVPKSTDKLVKAGIVTTCDKQSKLPVCVLTSLEVTLKNVLGLTVTNKEIATAVFINTGKADFLDKGLTPDQTIKFITSFCDTEALTRNDFKTAIDNGKTFLTDFKTGTITTPNSLYPDDRSKDITTIISHSVSVIGYDEDGNFIYIDPALGKAQVAPSSEMGFSYSIIIKGKK